MRRQPVTIEGLEGLFYTGVKLSKRLELNDQLADEANKYLSAPLTLHALVVTEDGKPAKSVDEWDDWCGEHIELASRAVNEARELLGSIDEAKKK